MPGECRRFCSGQSTSHPQGSTEQGSRLWLHSIQSTWKPRVSTCFNQSFYLLWEQRVGAVSYTHLDVYKRQQHSRALGDSHVVQIVFRSDDFGGSGQVWRGQQGAAVITAESDEMGLPGFVKTPQPPGHAVSLSSRTAPQAKSGLEWATRPFSHSR